MQTELLMEQASFKKQEAADTIHDLNDKKISQLTQEEAKRVREDWDVHFNDRNYRDGRFKVVPKVGYPRRFHDKSKAIDYLYEQSVSSILFEGTDKGDRVLITREVNK